MPIVAYNKVHEPRWRCNPPFNNLRNPRLCTAEPAAAKETGSENSHSRNRHKTQREDQRAAGELRLGERDAGETREALEKKRNFKKTLLHGTEASDPASLRGGGRLALISGRCGENVWCWRWESTGNILATLLSILETLEHPTKETTFKRESENCNSNLNWHRGSLCV